MSKQIKSIKSNKGMRRGGVGGEWGTREARETIRQGRGLGREDGGIEGGKEEWGRWSKGKFGKRC